MTGDSHGMADRSATAGDSLGQPDPRALRDELHRLFRAGVAAALPGPAVRQALTREPLPELKDGCHYILAFGKAAPQMARAALDCLPQDARLRALVVTHHEGVAPVPGAEVLGAGHPVPDAAGLRAAARLEAIAAEAGAGDHVLCLISGGASALLPAPRAGLTLADKIAVNRLLLGSGFDIAAMNLVRQQLSRLKGGGLARTAAPAPLRALILSDVIGDDPRVIASGPTAPPLGTPSEAIETLRQGGLWDRVPDAVRRALAADADRLRGDMDAGLRTIAMPNADTGADRGVDRGTDAGASEDAGDRASARPGAELRGGAAAATGPGADVHAEATRTRVSGTEPANRIIGSNLRSLAAIVAAAPAGLPARIVSDRLSGDVAQAAQRIGDAARAQAGPGLLIWGGETTVRLTGTGRGGRNQELALRVAGLLRDLPGCWAFLSGGTDGRDGPTEAAGGVVDAGTWARIADAGLDPAALLAQNDSHQALAASGDLLITGATGTNVADIQLFLRGPLPAEDQ